MRGVHPPETMMHFPPCFRKIFGLSEIFLQLFLPFPDKFFDFHPQQFLMTFFSNFPPIFAVSVHFPPVSRKLFFPPYFYKFPSCFRQIHLLFTYFTCISPLL